MAEGSQKSPRKPVETYLLENEVDEAFTTYPSKILTRIAS